MIRRTTMALATAGLLAAAPALAQDTPKVSGTVQKVDESAGKITIHHGPIPNLDMGEMTMVFRAADPAMLKQVKKGDTIQFTADRVDGHLTVTSIARAR